MSLSRNEKFVKISSKKEEKQKSNGASTVT
jgi:hypothetical protein